MTERLAILLAGLDQVDVGLSTRPFDLDISAQPAYYFIATPEHLATFAKGIKIVAGKFLLLEDGALALIVVEKQGREAVAGTGIDDDGAVPPTNAWRADE